MGLQKGFDFKLCCSAPMEEKCLHHDHQLKLDEYLLTEQYFGRMQVRKGVGISFGFSKA